MLSFSFFCFIRFCLALFAFNWLGFVWLCLVSFAFICFIHINLLSHEFVCFCLVHIAFVLLDLFLFYLFHCILFLLLLHDKINTKYRLIYVFITVMQLPNYILTFCAFLMINCLNAMIIMWFN